MHIFFLCLLASMEGEIGPRYDKLKAIDETEEKQYSGHLPVFKSGQIRERI